MIKALKNRLRLPVIRMPERAKIENFVSDAAMIGGFLMLLKGLYMIYPPTMWIIGGILVFLFGFPARRRGK